MLRAGEILVFNTQDPWRNYIVRTFPNHTVTEIDFRDIPLVDFRDYHIVYVTDDYHNESTPSYALALNARQADLASFVENGGRVIAGVQAFGGSSRANGDEYGFLPASWVRGQAPGVRIFGDDVNVPQPQQSHPLFRGLRLQPHPNDLEDWGSSYHGTLPGGTLPVLAWNFQPPQPLIRAGPMGAGRVVIWTLDPDFHRNPAATRLVENAVDWVSCLDTEELKARCNNENGANQVKATVSHGMPGAKVSLELEGGAAFDTYFDRSGKASAEWEGVPPGPAKVTAMLACGDLLETPVGFECPPDRCTGIEKLKVICRDPNGPNVLRATIKNGVPFAPVEFLLDDGLPQNRRLNEEGKSTVKWFDVAEGRRVIRALLACGDEKQKSVACP